MIKEGAFGGTYCRDIYTGVTGTWHKKSRKEFDQQILIRSIIPQVIMMAVSINMVLNAEHRQDFWGNKGWNNKTDPPYSWFQWYFRYWLGR